MKQFLLYLLLIFALPLAAQEIKVSGTVTSAEDGEPLIGATVMAEGSSHGVATDLDGHFDLTMKSGQTIKVTYVGCEPYRKKLTASQTLDIVLSGIPELDEVVVVGYGTMKKSDLTGSVTSVASENLKKTPAPSLANALQGQAAGVTVNSLSGRPGAQAEVRIRGVGTVNSPAPIYVVDGVITDDISFLSPNDIESTEILKDASATAIYGSRGANGVIIVTTRTGARDKRASISFDAYAGIQQRWRKLDVMNAKNFADTYVNINANAASRRVYENDGLNKWLYLFKGLGASPYSPLPAGCNPNSPSMFDYSAVDTDWQDEVFRDAWIQNYHLSIDGAGERFTYSLSGSWFDQQGTMIGSDYNRVTARLNTSYKATDWLTVGENLSFMSSVAKNAFESGDNSISEGSNMLVAAMAMAPWDPTHFPKGTVTKNGKDLSGAVAPATNFTNVTSPFSMIEYSHPKVQTSRWVGNVYAEIRPIPYLTFRSTFNFDYRLVTDRSFGDAYEVSAYDKREHNFLASSMAKHFNYTVDNILTYARTIGKHNFSVMAGQTCEQYSYYSIGGSGSDILNPTETNWYLSQVTDNFSRPSDGVSRARRLSWLGRVHYSFADRYMATVNFRADGSSKFPEKAWGYFPSFALAWRMDQESWLRDTSWLNNLKLRFGWGQVGNDNIGNNAFLLTMFNQGPTFVDYVFGKDQQLANGATVLTWINNGGHWENTEQWSLGLDFGFFNNRLNGSIDAFIRDTKDMLMSVNAPAHVGNRYSATANVGEVRNKGIEISLEHRNHVGNDFHYSISGNVSFISNKLTKLNGGAPIYTNHDGMQVVDQGFPLYYFWGYHYDGIYRTDQEALDYLTNYTAQDIPFHAGDSKYRDLNGDGKIDSNDRTNLGSAIPWLNYGLNLNFFYRDFDLQLFFQGVGGNKIYNFQRSKLESNGSTSIMSPVMKDAWTANNPNGSIPDPRNSINYYTSDRFLEDGSYFRLKNIQLGYTIPAKAMHKIGFQNCRIYVQGGNIFTITKYKGFDPEVSSGVDFGNYPQSRSFIFGVNITY